MAARDQAGKAGVSKRRPASSACHTAPEISHLQPLYGAPATPDTPALEQRRRSRVGSGETGGSLLDKRMGSRWTWREPGWLEYAAVVAAVLYAGMVTGSSYGEIALAQCAALLLCTLLHAAFAQRAPPPLRILALAPPSSFLPDILQRSTIRVGSSETPGSSEALVPLSDLTDALASEIAAQIAAGTQIGMAVSVYLHGRPIALSCGGLCRGVRPGEGAWRAVSPADLFMGYSACKGVAAAALLTCVDRGEVDYDAPLSSVWPEAATGDRSRLRVCNPAVIPPAP